MKSFTPKSNRLIRKVARQVSEHQIAEQGSSFELLSPNDTVVGTVPELAKRLFVAATQFGRLAHMMEIQRSMLGPCDRREQLYAKMRHFEQLGKISYDTAWAETILDPSCPVKEDQHFHIKAEWKLVPCRDKEHDPQEDQEDQERKIDDVIETIVAGTPVDGAFVRPVDGGFMLAIEAKDLKERLAKKKAEMEDERLKNSKPN